jgi:hypothetical protein
MSLFEKLHESTHRLPGVPDHRVQPRGHQASPRHGRSRQGSSDARGLRHPSRDHTHARPPRVLIEWQRRVAALFGQDLK